MVIETMKAVLSKVWSVLFLKLNRNIQSSSIKIILFTVKRKVGLQVLMLKEDYWKHHLVQDSILKAVLAKWKRKWIIWDKSSIIQSHKGKQVFKFDNRLWNKTTKVFGKIPKRQKNETRSPLGTNKGAGPPKDRKKL